MLHVMTHASLMVGDQAIEALKAFGDSKEAAAKEQSSALRRASREAMSRAKSSVALARWMGDKLQLGIALVYLAHAHVMANRLKEGMKVATEAEALFQEIGDEQEQVHALVLVAEIYALQKNKDEAIEAAQRAMDLARLLGDVQVESRCQAVIDAMTVKAAPVAQQAALPSFVMQAQPEQADSAAVAQAPGLDAEWVMETIHKVVTQSLSDDDVEVYADNPLMEMGMDSLTAVAFRNGLNGALGMNLPAALMFDYPSMRSICDHVVESSRG